MNNLKNNIKKGFTIIPNKLILDATLTDRARFVFCYMASKPDDWSFYHSAMAKELGYSIDTLRKYIEELLLSGWLCREERRGEAGKFTTYDYTLNDTKSTVSEKTRNGKNPHPEKTATEKTRTTNKDLNKKRPKQKNTSTEMAANKFADAITDIYENGEPEPVIITVEQPADPTPPKLRATPPKSDKAPNLVYQLFEAYAKFYEGKGVPMSRNKSGSYYMPTKDANHVNLWMTWAKGMPSASGDLLADWQAYLEAAWQYGDKFIKGNFTPAVLYTQATKIVAAVNRQRMQQIELERALEANDINDLLNP
jgi:hypothetical protein